MTSIHQLLLFHHLWRPTGNGLRCMCLCNTLRLAMASHHPGESSMTVCRCRENFTGCVQWQFYFVHAAGSFNVINLLLQDKFFNEDGIIVLGDENNTLAQKQKL